MLDLTTSIAGPYAGMLLGDLGAEVVKVERPRRGDDCRAWGPPFLDGESLWFLSVNRNKRSITLDYTGAEGRSVLDDLARQCDVVLVNLVARAQRKLGIDAATLAAVRPDLVHVSLTGFGLAGARADMPCYDLIAEGYSSVMDLTGEADNDPQKIGTPAADLIAGMDAAMLALVALFDRARTGRGHVVDVAMVDSMTRFMSPLGAMLARDAKAPVEQLYEPLAIQDIQMAADVLRTVHDASHGEDGYVSLEVSPHLAHDTQRTISEAKRLRGLVDRPNLMVKVPATAAGIPAIEQLIADGLNINVTLMFSMADYEAVARAYIKGLERCAKPSEVASVASFFVSRVDTGVDKELEKIATPEASALCGKIAIANSKMVYLRLRLQYRH